MPKLVDLTGQKFGRLTVISRAENKNNKTMWLCECDCGNECIVRGDGLKKGGTMSCGCFHKERAVEANFKDEIGNHYGLLTVIKPIKKDDKGETVWLCECQCGKQVEVRGSTLRNRHTQSCGCLQKVKVSNANLKNEIGNKYGKLTVINYVGMKNGRALWRCRCDCGNEVTTYGVWLRYGNVSSCGCLISKGETKIEQILQNNSIQYTKQYVFNDLLSQKGYPLRFDFAVFINSSLWCLIEYQGEQHYAKEYLGSWNSPKAHDEMKRNYCKNNNIPLVEISYKDYDRLDWQYLKAILLLEDKFYDKKT